MGLARAWRVLALAGLALLAAATASPSTAAPTFPKLTGRVVDEAHILSAPAVADLTTRLAALQAKTSRQLVVVTIPSLQGYEIADYGYQLGRAWGVGRKDIDNGVLLIVAPTEHKVRIEVGYGLEGVVTDALSSVILQTRVLPKFKAGDMPGGVVAGADALIEQLSLDPSTAEKRVADAAAARQAGAAGGDAAPNPLVLLLVFLFVVFMLRTLFRNRGGSWIAPIVWGAGSALGGGGRYDGDGGGGEGGFSGGGGSFGGGGSSGSW